MFKWEELFQQSMNPKRFNYWLRCGCRGGDVEEVLERLSWGSDPNCATKKWRYTPLMCGISGHRPRADVVLALIEAGADPTLLDWKGRTALDHARRKFDRIRGRQPRRSRYVDENNNLQLPKWQQQVLDTLRKLDRKNGTDAASQFWHMRLKSERKIYDDPAEVERIIAILEKFEREKAT